MRDKIRSKWIYYAANQVAPLAANLVAPLSANGLAPYWCQLTNGITIGVELCDLPLETEAYEENAKVQVLEDISRVYASACRGEELIIGDASGYLRAFDKTGKQLWFHFIGSSVGDIDLSKDGKTLVCTTYAGFISIF